MEDIDVRVNRVTRDDSGNILSSLPVSEIAIVLDRDKKETGWLEVDVLRVVAVALNLDEGFLQVAVRLGGYDSRKGWHNDPNYGPATWTISRLQGKRLWETHVQGKKRFDFAEILKIMKDENVIPFTAKQVWRIADLEVIGQS